MLPSLTPCTFKSAAADQCGELVEVQAADSLRLPAFRDQSASAVRIVNASWRVVDVQLGYVGFDDLHLGSTCRSAARADDHPVQERPIIALYIRNGPVGRHDLLDLARGSALFRRLARGCVVGVEEVYGEPLMIIGQLRRPNILDLPRGFMVGRGDADDTKPAFVYVDRIVVLL